MHIQLYTHYLANSAHALVDCFNGPLNFVATRATHYDLIISDFYFEQANLDFYFEYIDCNKLIIVSGNVLEKEVKCLAVFKKSSIHTKSNILSLINLLRSRPLLHLVEQ